MFDKISSRNYKKVIRQAEKEKNDQLVLVLKQDMNGYGKPNMTEKEIKEEHLMLQRFISLDFMIEEEDDDDSQEEEKKEESGESSSSFDFDAEPVMFKSPALLKIEENVAEKKQKLDEID